MALLCVVCCMILAVLIISRCLSLVWMLVSCLLCSSWKRAADSRRLLVRLTNWVIEVTFRISTRMRVCRKWVHVLSYDVMDYSPS